MLHTAPFTVVISSTVKHVREVHCDPGAFGGGGNQGITLSCGRGCRGGGGGGPCSGGGAVLVVLTWSVPTVHQVGVVTVVGCQVKQEVILALREYRGER